MIKFNKANQKLSKQILKSAQIMEFYNKNIIMSMGLKRGSVDINKSYTNKSQNIIEEVFEPFDFQLEKRNI
jgi:hypothetical protein